MGATRKSICFLNSNGFTVWPWASGHAGELKKSGFESRTSSMSLGCILSKIGVPSTMRLAFAAAASNIQCQVLHSTKPPSGSSSSIGNSQSGTPSTWVQIVVCNFSVGFVLAFGATVGWSGFSKDVRPRSLRARSWGSSSLL